MIPALVGWLALEVVVEGCWGKWYWGWNGDSEVALSWVGEMCNRVCSVAPDDTLGMIVVILESYASPEVSGMLSTSLSGTAASAKSADSIT